MQELRCLFLLLMIALTISLGGKAQGPREMTLPIYFKQGTGVVPDKVSDIGPLSISSRRSGKANPSLFFLQFSKLPTGQEQRQLNAAGIIFLEYIPENCFLVSIRQQWSARALRNIGVIKTMPWDPSFKKMDLVKQPAWSTSGDLLKYHLLLAPGTDSNLAKKILNEFQGNHPASLKAPVFLQDNLLEIRAAAATIEALTALPIFRYALPAPELIPLNGPSADNLLARVVQEGSGGLPGLKGKNVVLGLGDMGRIDHIDNGYNEDGPVYPGGYHATHVAGTMAGAGILNPLFTGFAPEATVLTDYFNTIINKAPFLYEHKRMMATNNSYGGGSSCGPFSGMYSGYCGQVDQQLLDYPNLMHVFAAGNSGSLICGAAPKGYRSIDNAFQAAKNILTVGGTAKDGNSNGFSKGPVRDGRIKPEIVAIGNNVVSTTLNNSYGGEWGTSMAAPQVTGAWALLVERYRQLNAGQDPPGDLLKAILCNTATDIGTKGVDFSNGFGWLNLKKGVDVVADQSYRSGIAEQDGEQVFDLFIDTEVFDCKIMLYWHDKPASYYTYKNLVNDLDLSVEIPGGAILDPMILDTSNTGLLKPATMGKDHINNIEQVVIDHALPGHYKIRVKGFSIPFGPQAFKIVYNWEKPGLQLIQPAGGEQWKPGEQRGIHWKDAGRTGDTYRFDFSADDGASWTSLPALTGTYNRVDWSIPAISTARARIKITNNQSGESTLSEPFTILPEINFSLSSTCANTINVSWKKPPGIDSISLLQYNKGEFEQVAISTGTTYSLGGLAQGPNYWITVRPILQGHLGERSIAKSIRTAKTNCPPSGLPGDIALNAIILPPVPREGTSSSINTPVNIKVELVNNGIINFADTLFLQASSGATLLGVDTLFKNFSPGEKYQWSTHLNFTSVPSDSFVINTSIIAKTDPKSDNNVRDTIWHFLPNNPLILPFTENFSGLKDSTYGRPGIVGTPGAVAWDFFTSSPSILTLTKQEAPANGFSIYSHYTKQDFALTGNFDLSGYTLTDNIRASLEIPDLSAFDPVLSIRGSDTDQWLDLFQGQPLTSNLLKNINISSVLAKGGQSLSTSFQFRISGLSPDLAQQFRLISQFTLSISKADLALSGITANKRNLTDGDTALVELELRNRLLTPSGPFVVELKSPSGERYTKNIGFLEAGDSLKVRFAVPVTGWTAPITAFQAWITDPLEDYLQDDTAFLYLNYARKVSQYPYLEGFESDEAGWATGSLYVLSGKAEGPAKAISAANGRQYWSTRWITDEDGIADVLRGGSLVSPFFVLNTLTNPYLSISVNQQICNAYDSVWLEYSRDTGRSWIRLIPPGTGATNWYSPFKKAWTNCGNDYWQVVSVPLPKESPGIRVKLVTARRKTAMHPLPRTEAGFLVDDIHLYDRQYPVYSMPQALKGIAPATDTAWNSFVVQGTIAASTNQKRNSMRTELSLSADGSGRVVNGINVFPRSWAFTGAGNTGTESRVRLYFTHQEVMKWLGEVSCDSCPSGKISPYDLAVYRYSGPNPSINTTETDNLSGFSESWRPEDFDLVPYDSGYYAEIASKPYGEFYLGIPDDRPEISFSFVASRQPGSNIVWLNWINPEPSGTVRYEIERARRHEGPLVFEKVGEIGQLGAGTHYYFSDAPGDLPGAYHYRIRIVESNGRFRYSGLQSISFEDQILARVYPNPGTGRNQRLFLENAEGKNLSLTLYDLMGRSYWHKSLKPVAAAQWLPLDFGEKKLGAGVYLLKIASETEITSIRLVISKN